MTLEEMVMVTEVVRAVNGEENKEGRRGRRWQGNRDV